MAEQNKINVFISYSWDSMEHQEWVLQLSEIIESNGGSAIVDQNQKFGTHLRIFMERFIKAADVVLIIMTPPYKDKAQNLKNGVGYEYNIITKDLFATIGTNEKYIGVLRNGDHSLSVPDFIEDFKYVDLRQGVEYEKNLKKLIAQILKIPMKQPDENKSNSKIMENDYKELDNLTNEIKSKAFTYFKKFYINDQEVLTKLKISTIIGEWETEIETYSKALISKFNPVKMEIAEDYAEDFKNDVFGSILWTVSSARKTNNPDLAKYKMHFRDANAGEVFETVNGILTESHQYVVRIADILNYNKIKKQEELMLDYLDHETMFMNKIIGFGIRSELLHRYYPAHFAVMTQKSLWAMYFICDTAKEFITIEQQDRKGLMRASHNWQYPYERFTFLMNELAKEFELWVLKYGIKLKPEYRFGYVNMFLSEIDKFHKKDINLLHEWVQTKK
ncbi:toll/interleukin-1 receptor domain-containing protein [Flavobacterium aquidurense]|uniref:toll/interleukin-1 receptor domain-containing protein n=1 Tax=Flavobacterium aquidurense TaxID=362413 RepID=UPI00375652DF